MDISILPVGTKLMWDAPEPYPGYVRNPDKKGRVIYPITILGHVKYGCTFVGNSGNNFYVSDDSEAAERFIRVPTKEELKTLKWK